MKNILIMGVGRAGKTTLSEMIKEKYNSYNLIHSDTLKWALIRAEGKEDYYDNNVEKQNEFEHSEYFQKVILEFFNSQIRNDVKGYGHILESGQLHPKMVKELINFNDTKVICLGLGSLTKDEIINLCIGHDKGKDWTYGLEREKLERYAENWYKYNETLKIECPKYGIEYIDTSKNRNAVLEELLQKLTNN